MRKADQNTIEIQTISDFSPTKHCVYSLRRSRHHMVRSGESEVHDLWKRSLPWAVQEPRRSECARTCLLRKEVDFQQLRDP